MNALKTGIDATAQIIRGESPAGLQTLAAEYHDRFQPATPEQRALVDTLVHCDWLQRRLRLAEAHLWEHAFERMDRWESDTEAPLGEAFSSNSQSFSRLQRRIDSVERNYHRAIKELRRLQSAAHEPEPPSEIGFVPQAPPPHGATTLQPLSSPISASPRLRVKPFTRPPSRSHGTHQPASSPTRSTPS